MTDSSPPDSTDSNPMVQDPLASGPLAEDSLQSNANSSGELDALMSLLQVIEGQPLDQRARAFAQVHEKLRSALEGGDVSA